MTHITANDISALAAPHYGLLAKLNSDPQQYLEEIPHVAEPRLALKNGDDQIVDQAPLTVEALQALIDLMAVGALERHCFPDNDRRIAYRLSGRAA